MSRKAKVVDDDGNIVEIDVDDLKCGRIQHDSLDDDILDRIRDIYDYIRDSLDIATLEQFELDFMRDCNPEKEIIVWENIVRACKIAMDLYDNEDESTEELKASFLDILLLASINTLTPEEEEYEIVKELRNIFNNL